MDFNVTVGRTPPALSSESAPSVSNLSTPELSAARDEYAKMLNDPTHPMYEDLRQGGTKSNDYLNTLHQKALSHPAAPPPPLPVTIAPTSLSGTTGGSEDAEFALSPEDVAGIEALKQDWGDQFQEHHADARFGMERLTRVFGGEADDLTAAFLAAGGNLKQLMNVLRHFGNAARGYAP